jgi:hypothetical protein
MAGVALAAGMAACAFFVSIDPALARCSVPRFNFTFGQAAVSTTMYADSGARCILKLHEARASVFKSVRTVARPTKGSVAALNPLNVAYTSRRGYQGGDSFSFDLVGTRNGAPATTRFTVTVSVSGGGPGIAPAANTIAKSGSKSGSKSGARQAATPNALQARCLQQVGAGKDPVTGRWLFYVSEGDAMSRLDMYKMCLAGGDRAKANRIAVPEIWATHPGDRGPTYKGR